MTRANNASNKKPLLASYGGGHANIIANIAHGLIARGIEPNIIGFTTARCYFANQGLEPSSVLAILDCDKECYFQYLPVVRKYLPLENHPDISLEETHAYFVIGLRDLVERYGYKRALELLESQGRKAFCPISAMERFLKKTQPSCVVTTTSPRFELALILAARKLGIPSLAISDLFLINEREWIIEEKYADHLTVISEQLRSELIQSGLVDTKVHVTGNPAFDSLAPRPCDLERRQTLRAQLGIENKVVILWPSPSTTQSSLYARDLLSPDEVVVAFESLCHKDSKFSYILRPHPNAPYDLPKEAINGLLDPGLCAYDALLVADVVCVELSTMGLQAALRGLPVICVGFSNEAIYPRYGIANSVENICEAVELLLSNKKLNSLNHANSIFEVGNSTNKIVDLILNISL